MEKGRKSLKNKKTKADYLSDIKKIDIYQHLKFNMRNEDKICKENNLESIYCIPCKLSKCEKCGLEKHSNHILIDKKNYLLIEKNLNNMINQIDNQISTYNLVQNFKPVKEKIINKINEMFVQINEKINKLKESKINEINKIFDDISKNILHFQKKLKNVKNEIKDYLYKNKDFFNFKNDIIDINNYNSVNNNNNNNNNNNINTLSINTNNNSLKTPIKSPRNVLNKTSNNKKLFSPKSSNKVLNLNINNQLNPIYNNDNYNSLFLINYELMYIVQSTGKSADNILNTFQNNINNIEKAQENNISNLITKINQLISDSNNIFSNNNSVSYDFTLALRELENINFNDVKIRIDKYNLFNSDFKRKVYESIMQHGNLKGIETQIKQSEAYSYKKDGDSILFKGRKKVNPLARNKSETKSIKSANNNNINSNNPNNLIPQFLVNLKHPDEVVLNHNLIIKLYSFLLIELYEQYFKQETKELQSSHADLLIKSDDDDDAPKDNGKAIENTNQIQIYIRKENLMTKHTVDLKINPYSYNKFPIGCRSILIGDKLYITGGKDPQKYYKTVLIYDIKKKKLKRIMDLNTAHAFHTIVYIDIFQTLMVIGGEQNKNVEIFDPIVNRWINLPELNCPRCNIVFQFDQPRGIMYALFGIEGLYIDSEYSTEIEYLDLKNLKDGWTRLNYNNNAQIDLKTYLNIIEINNDFTLIYGGRSMRDSMRAICVLNKDKKVVTRVDKKMMDIIREETKYSRRLSKFMVGLNDNTI